MKNFFPARGLLLSWLALAGAGSALAQPAVTARSPVRNALSATRTTNVALTFSQTMNAATDQNVRVFSHQRGGKKAGAYTTAGNTITFNPTTDFRPGEVVSVTVPPSVTSGGGAAAVKHVYQFTAGVTGGSGYYTAPAFGAELNPGIDPYYTTVGDVDNDGDLDMVVASESETTVQVLLNNGFGLFIAGSTVAAGTTRRAELGDLDNDGDLDLITADDFTNVVRVRLNNGSGTFGGGTNLALTATDIALGDLDADGDLDFISVNQANRTVSVNLNSGAGTFSAGTAVVLGGDASFGALFGVELADIDSDGDLDLLTSDYEFGRVFTRFNNGNAAFSGGATIQFSHLTLGLAVGDLDGDGDPDFIAAGAPALFGSSLDQSEVCFNNGAGTFTVATANPALSLFHGFDCRLGDVDGDGDLDFVAPAGADHPYVNVRLNDGAGTFVASPTAPDVALADDAFFVSVADFDNDGDLDLATPKNTVSVRLNQSQFVVSSANPAGNAVAAPPAASLGITFSKPVDNTTAAGLRVYGAQAGGKKAGSRSAVGTVLTFNPAVDFKSGERVDITVPATVEATGGQPLQRPHVYQFTAATAGGSGYFNSAPDLTVAGGVNDVVSGDVDGDGDLDVLVAQATDNQVRIRRNNGNGTYAAATTVNVGDDPRTLALADVDADGDLDLITANLSDGTLSIRLNNGSGTFSGGTNPSAGMSNPNELATGDLDGDGDLDLLVGGIQGMRTLRNNGAGGFVAGPTPSVSGRASVALGDLDNDGDLDVVGASLDDSNVAIHLNNGDMTFAAQGTISVGTDPFSVIVADVDGDGDQDVLTANYGAASVSVRRNNGNATFAAATSVNVGSTPMEVMAGDVDGDGDLDLVTRHDSGNAYRVALNSGAGIFTTGYSTNLAGSTFGMDLADMDGDGDLDLLASQYAAGKVLVRLNEPPFTLTAVSPVRHTTTAPRGANVNLTFSAAVDATTAPQVRIFASQGEGRKATSDAGAGSVLTLNPASDFKPGEQVSVTVPATVQSATGVPVAPRVYQFTAAATGGLGTFTSAPDVPLGAAPTEVALADLNNDGHLDLVAGAFADNALNVRIGDGAGGFGGALNLPFFQTRDLVVADFDADGDLDIVAINLDGCTQWRNNGNATFGAPGVIVNGPGLGGLHGTAADVNGDGTLDLLVGNQNGSVRVFANVGAGAFAILATVTTPVGSRDITCADVDGDGDLDLLVANAMSNTVSSYRNNGSGAFGAGTALVVGTFPKSVVAGDLDNDGDMDLAVANNNSANVSICRNNGAGTFSVFATLATGTPGTLALADFDGDGDLDLITTANGARIWRNTGTGVFTAGADGNSFGTGLTVGDLDGDGDLDFVNSVSPDNLAQVRLNQNAFLVTAVSPTRNDADAPRAANVAVTFNQGVNVGTRDRIRIWGQQRGGKKVGAYSSLGTTVTFNPATNFAPGEVVNVTVPTTVVSSGGRWRASTSTSTARRPPAGRPRLPVSFTPPTAAPPWKP